MKAFLILSILLAQSFVFGESENGKVQAFYERVVQVAKESVGLQAVPSVNGKHFLSDCIGFIDYVYYRAGFDLQKAYGKGRGGVSSLYAGLAGRGYIYDSKNASLGDLIFFDNTYDINRNGEWDDPLSHIGIIAGYGKHNTMYYIHFGSRGVEQRSINLTYPNTHAFKQADGSLYQINSYLRRDRGEGYQPKQYVASSFYRAFAHIRFKVKEVDDPGTKPGN